ncbi:MAG: hypothetical protein ABJE10_08080 [bacterium]
MRRTRLYAFTRYFFTTELNMPAPAVLALVLVLAVPPDTGQVVSRDTVVGPTQSALAVGLRAVEDTVPRRRRAIEVGEWYARRLRIHRLGSYAIYPLFALQAIAGNQIFKDPRSAPEWAKTSHRVGATGLATVFTLNTVTGLWNLWDSRSVSQDRARRTTHALLMLTSDAGFTYAGLRLSDQAENSVDKRREHRLWAYGSMATALTGVGVITLGRED